MVASTSAIDIHLSLVSSLMYRKAAYINATHCVLMLCAIKYRNHNMQILQNDTR